MSENFFDYLPLVLTQLAYAGLTILGIWLIAYPIEKAIRAARARSIRRTDALEIISFELNAIRRLYEHDLKTSL